MAKIWRRFNDRAAAFPVRAQKRVEGNLTKYDDNPDLSHDAELAHEEHTAMLEFTQNRFVIGRRAMHRGRHVTIA